MQCPSNLRGELTRISKWGAGSVAGAFQHSDRSTAAEDILVGATGTGDADAAGDHDTVDDWNPAARQENAAAMRDGEATQPSLARLRRHFCCGQMESGSRVGLVESKLSGPRLSAVHPSDSDRIAGFIHDRDRHCNAHGLCVFLG